MKDGTVTGCTGLSTGYSCTGTDAPSVADSSLACSDGTPGTNGATNYCCLQNASTVCMSDPTVAGCTGSSYGFSCASNATPATANPSLTCSTGTPGNNGLKLYCCQ